MWTGVLFAKSDYTSKASHTHTHRLEVTSIHLKAKQISLLSFFFFFKVSVAKRCPILEMVDPSGLDQE